VWRLLLLFAVGVSSAGNAADGALLGDFAERGETWLHYDAFLAGVRVGEAKVHLRLAAGRYEIRGTALALGMVERYSEWRNQFMAEGSVTDAGAQPETFSYLETDRNKRREVAVRSGVLQVTKNGKVRPARPTPPGLDVLSGLFIRPHCKGDQVLHTGRHGYRLSRLASEPGRCRYVVVDDDQDRYEVELTLARRDGLVVPGRFAFRGLLNGFLELREPEQAGRDPARAPVDP
jgi:hypothetical protein